jgi:hypothetical protein
MLLVDVLLRVVVLTEDDDARGRDPARVCDLRSDRERKTPIAAL